MREESRLANWQKSGFSCHLNLCDLNLLVFCLLKKKKIQLAKTVLQLPLASLNFRDIKGTYLNLTKAIYDKPTAKNHSEQWKAFPL